MLASVYLEIVYKGVDSCWVSDGGGAVERDRGTLRKVGDGGVSSHCDMLLDVERMLPGITGELERDRAVERETGCADDVASPLPKT